MSEPQQHDKPLELHVLNPRTVTLAEFFVRRAYTILFIRWGTIQ